jgi:hypothetical protein
MMRGPLYKYMSEDHDRLDALLERAVAEPGVIDMEPYAEFRKGLLRHISMEEKIILPAIARCQGGRKAAMADRLRTDHSAIVSLLVPPPTTSIVLTLRSIFAAHNPLEEGEGGLYELFETSAGPEAETMIETLKAAPAVLVVPHNPQEGVLELAKRAVVKAGYEFKVG